MKDPVVIIGVGEMGGVFARGFLRLGHPVHPLTRDQDMQNVAAHIPNPALVLVAVGEKDLAGALESIPEVWRTNCCLLQNELLPGDWEALTDPTVISVWFEKKPGMDFKVIIPSPVYGPKAQLIADALGSLGIQTSVLDSDEDLLFELVLKNLYILTTNIAGLKVGGNVGELWNKHQEFCIKVASEVVQIQEGLTAQKFDSKRMINAMVKAFDGDTGHNCMGRSAPARLARALEHAGNLNLNLPTLTALSTH
jgi:ketopantoate reductase